jgi:predicted nucleic acid-binding protein
MNTAVRVVLNSHVVLSALVFRDGPAGQVRQAWQRGLVLPLANYLPYAETVHIPQPPPMVPECRDELDFSFMHLTMAACRDNAALTKPTPCGAQPRESFHVPIRFHHEPRRQNRAAQTPYS